MQLLEEVIIERNLLDELCYTNHWVSAMLMVSLPTRL